MFGVLQVYCMYVSLVSAVVTKNRFTTAHEKAFVGGDARPHERGAAAKANRVRKF